MIYPSRLLVFNGFPHEDYFSYNFTVSPLNIFTKRTLLSDIARIFDPLGYIAPVTFQLKLLFQLTWINKLGWDDQLPETIRHIWSAARSDLPRLQELKLSRYIGFKDVQLHGFADASTKGYAAALYIRRFLENGNIATNLVFAKTKLAPVKQISILDSSYARHIYLLNSLNIYKPF